MTPPGSKFMITKPIQIREQLLLLGPGMLKPLGGHVQEMVHAWRSGKVSNRILDMFLGTYIQSYLAICEAVQRQANQ